MITERFQDQDLLRVGSGDSYLLLAPAHGGRLVRWVHRGEDILYWPDDADWTRVAKVRGGNPLLFPFIGRHFVDGEAGRWRDDEGVIREMPQHGFARDLPFTVEEASEHAVTLSLTASHATRANYPFDFAFAITYRLVEDGLESSIHVSNRGAAPMPWYAGHHFYFRLPHGLRAQCRLDLPAADRVRQTADGALTEPEPGSTHYALDDVSLQDTFHVLRGPQHDARITAPQAETAARRIELSLNPSSPWYAITTWSERPDADFYCVEPWTGLPDAIHNGHGLRWLIADQSEVAQCKLVVSAEATLV